MLKKKIVSKYSKFVSVIATVIGMMIYTGKNAHVLANNPSDALSKSGIKANGDIGGLYSSLNNVVYVVMALGGFWIVAMIIWGGMTLASSGGNPQKRTEGFIKLGLSLVGAYVIFKAYDIAGWATGLGGSVS